MSGIERTEFPEITFSEALEILKMIRVKNIKTVAALAGELGYSPTSHGGLFFYKRAALSKHYGLLEPSKTVITLTRLGERIAHPLSTADETAAKYEAVSRVPLLKSLFAALGSDYHQDDFKPNLAQLTGASPAELETASKRMEGVYRDAIQYLQQSPPGQGSDLSSLFGGSSLLEGVRGSGARPPTSSHEAERPRGDGTTVPTFDKPVRNLHSEDGYFIRVVLDAGVIDEAIAVLQALRNRITHSDSSTPPPG